MFWQTLDGIGSFLLGMMLMTEGLKTPTGSAHRAILARMVRGSVSGARLGCRVDDAHTLLLGDGDVHNRVRERATSLAGYGLLFIGLDVL